MIGKTNASSGGTNGQIELSPYTFSTLPYSNRFHGSSYEKIIKFAIKSDENNSYNLLSGDGFIVKGYSITCAGLWVGNGDFTLIVTDETAISEVLTGIGIDKLDDGVYYLYLSAIDSSSAENGYVCLSAEYTKITISEGNISCVVYGHESNSYKTYTGLGIGHGMGVASSPLTNETIYPLICTKIS